MYHWILHVQKCRSRCLSCVKWIHSPPVITKIWHLLVLSGIGCTSFFYTDECCLVVKNKRWAVVQPPVSLLQEWKSFSLWKRKERLLVKPLPCQEHQGNSMKVQCPASSDLPLEMSFYHGSSCGGFPSSSCSCKNPHFNEQQKHKTHWPNQKNPII